MMYMGVRDRKIVRWGIRVKSGDIIIRNRDSLPSQFLQSNHKVGENRKEEQGADDGESDNLVEVTRISPSNHANAVLVHKPAISEDANADDSVEIRKFLRDIILRSVEKCEGQCANQHSNVEIGNPSSFVGKPHFSLDLDWGRNFLRYPDLGRQRVDGMVVPDGGQISFVVRLRLRDSVRSSILRADFKVFRERGEGGGRKWGQHVGYCGPGSTNDSAA